MRKLAVTLVLVVAMQSLASAVSLRSIPRWMSRHPRATKVTIATMGIVAGGTLGYMQRNHFCSYTYDGQPYYGTTCPAPKDASKVRK